MKITLTLSLTEESILKNLILSTFFIESNKADNSLEAIANLLHINHDVNAVSRTSIPVGSQTSSTCPVNPCLHGGLCELDNLQPSGKRCTCMSGYTGTLCQGMNKKIFNIIY